MNRISPRSILAQLARGLKRDLPAVFLALRKRETGWPAKITAALTLGYALSPIDLIPDFIPVVGYLDDLLLLPLLVMLTVRLIPPAVWEICRRESEGLWTNGIPSKWYFSIPIILFWIWLLWLLVRHLLTV